MAKKVIEVQYTFTPGTRTLVINRYVRQESLMLITNVTRGTVMYNFSDSDLRATSYTAVSSNTVQGVTPQTTTIVLNFNTTAMSANDKIQVMIDEESETMRTNETFTDPVDKMRVSTPQSMMDTDFEYSVQPSKWEFMPTVQNYPSYFSRGTGGNSFQFVSISGNGAGPRSTISVQCTANHNLATGDVVAVQETTNPLANGTYTVTVTGATTFTYVARGVVSGSVLEASVTIAYGGGLFDGAIIPMASAAGNSAAQSLVTITTTNPHNLFPGSPVSIVNASTGGINGDWVIQTVASPTTFVIQVTSSVGAVTLGSARLTTSPEAFIIHRSTDGGVSITPGGSYVGVMATRQTRRYFRYQSGKAMQFSTGWKATPTFDIDSVTSSGTTCAITTIQDHNLQIGAQVLVEGLGVITGVNPYNGSFFVQSITSAKAFTVTLPSTAADTTPTGTPTTTASVTCTQWRGSSVRTGLYDDQNGFYFEYDGNRVFACRRQSINEMIGRVACTNNSGLVTGTGTRFRRQFIVGDMVVIKGSSYKIGQIDSDTQMRISPAYRGPTVTNTRYLRTQTFKVPQSQWNMDRCDGTGPSGYNIDISKMQMAYIDYTWYGAGFIRFGFRGVNGNIVYCHRMPNNNVNTAAYMRSGNLPGRFEVENYGYYGRLTAGATGVRGAALGAADTTLYVEDASLWAPPTPSVPGAIMVRDGTNCELMTYTGIGAFNQTAGGFPLTGLVRRTTITNAGISAAGSFSASAYQFGGIGSNVTFTPDATFGGAGTSQVSIQEVRNTAAPVCSHWGVSVIMDGRFDNDKQLLFVGGMRRYLNIGASAIRPLIMVRIAPSVDSGNGRQFGVREIVNRMQLTLASMDVYSQGQFLIEGILNPASITGSGLTIPTSWPTVPVGGGSLSQIYYFDGTNTLGGQVSATGNVVGGDRIFGFYTENSGGTNFSVTSQDLRDIRDIGTSIISGDGNTTNPGYPNAPDILVITATNLNTASAANISTRISWTEAQA
jgi:hypothetical protein